MLIFVTILFLILDFLIVMFYTINVSNKTKDLKMQVELKSFCKIEDLRNINGQGHIYFINNKPAKRQSYIKILHYVNVKKWIKHVKINKTINTQTNQRYIEHVFIFDNQQNKISLP